MTASKLHVRGVGKWTYESGMPQKRGGSTVTSDSIANTWDHVAAKGAQNQHGNDDNRIEVIPQRIPNDQASRCSPSVEDLKTTDNPIDIGGEQQDPTQQRRHDLTPQDEDATLRTSQPLLTPKN